MQADPDISRAAAIIADKSRAAMLMVLADGETLPAGDLARYAHVSAQTASSHLARMLEAGLVKVENQGRHRYYSVANEHVAHLLEALSIVAQTPPVLTSTQHDAAKTLRYARTCYGHMAGVVGVAITDAMAERQILRECDAGWLVTPMGARFFDELGIDVDQLRRGHRPLTRTCLDWSERRYHLAGALGDAIANRYFKLGWIAHVRQSRAVRLTDRGRAALKDRLGIQI